MTEDQEEILKLYLLCVKTLQKNVRHSNHLLFTCVLQESRNMLHETFLAAKQNVCFLTNLA